MRHPSIKGRLILGSALLVAVVLLFSKVAMYREIDRSLRQEMDAQLLHSATLLSKSAELEAGGIVYEWQEALSSTPGLHIEGLFEFWDLKSGKATRSPNLGGNDLKFFHGALNTPVFEDIRLADGRVCRALGFLHLPFTNEYGRQEMKRRGKILDPMEFQQVIVLARETGDLEQSLSAARMNLLLSGLFTLLAISLAILLITNWTLRPLDKLAAHLLKRSSEVGTPLPEIPSNLPRELVGLASAFRTTLERVEDARAHEKDFALSAAHQLRTPIAGVGAILEQALSRPREIENLRERVGRALHLLRDMGQTIDSLMSLARIKGGIDQADPVFYDPATIVAQLVEEQKEGSGRDHQVELSLPEQPVKLFGDVGMFRILSSVLVENAFRHTPAGGRILIRIARQDDEGCILFIVNDAAGFDPSDSERIFRPFQRGKNTSVNTPGAGLGLALAKEISQRIGASLELTTDESPVISFKLTISGAGETRAGKGQIDER